MYQPLDESFYQAIEDWACEKYINMIQQTCYPYEKTFLRCWFCLYEPNYKTNAIINYV